METHMIPPGHIADDTVANADDDQAGYQLTTLEGWRGFIAEPPPPPTLLSEDEYRLLPSAQRLRYDEDRLDHHARLQVVATSTVRHTVTCGRRLVLLNKHAISARRGLIVSGPAGTGKTIAITQLGRAHELLDRARNPHVSGRIPVLYITVPPAATARMIAAEFARFLGLPFRRSSNITDIMEAVVGVCTDTRTGLVLVDELHNISLTSRAGAEVADTLKYFSERIPATFIYAGIDIEHSNLLSGTRGQQVAGRFTLIPTAPFPYNQEWKGLISTLEETLLLHRHRPGSLSDLDRYLHNRTGGMIGALSHAIRGAAIDAILTGIDAITEKSIAAIPLDHLTQARSRTTTRARR
ncbi:TniB family NTP-binding protein [Streptomyces sp. SPB074]|uniref:TniB family NTP-binding protein n=1 Tax=Streptomyces sp. (strain SPB074) TaxID=465543 RepID=UPI00017F11D8|nr:TniB family NTP-binding protein [Streptomyces sp. SPB074]EDY42215.1 ATP/GTP-binding protein [Streptomyces sp. SPB074]